ncbi:MAG: hypothetical protein KY468_06100 [Armatimonadetes bacterium]|nr:hypothetical protein [Armatimonadota bacterium]
MTKLLTFGVLALLLGMSGSAGVGKEGAGFRTPYARWKNGPPADPGYFPIAVWLQQPKNAPRYQQAGINLYVGLWKGPTEEQLAALKAAKMPVICDQNAVGLAHRDDPTIVGWMHDDEPDNAQPVTDPKTGKRTWGPPVPPSKIVEDYRRIKAKDPTRPVFLNLGQGVANDEWKGRGPGAKLDDYKTYVKGADIVSFDVYPVAGLDRPDGEEYLWYVAKGVSRLREWAGDRKILWNVIETTRIGGEKRPTPAQVRAEVWMSLIHGSTGIIYFVHEFAPAFNEHRLLDDPEMLAAVTEINRQIRALAPVLHRPTVANGAKVTSSDPDVPLASMVKRHDGATYLFTVGMRNAPTEGAFEIPGISSGEVEVIGENRTLALREGRFQDAFRPYDVHLYRIRRADSR